jgi:hypothetical protein
VTLLLLAAGATVYALLTPWKEVALIRQGNVAAAGIERDARAQMHAGDVEGVGRLRLRVPRGLATGVAGAEVGATAHDDGFQGDKSQKGFGVTVL